MNIEKEMRRDEATKLQIGTIYLVFYNVAQNLPKLIECWLHKYSYVIKLLQLRGNKGELALIEGVWRCGYDIRRLEHSIILSLFNVNHKYRKFSNINDTIMDWDNVVSTLKNTTLQCSSVQFLKIMTCRYFEPDPLM